MFIKKGAAAPFFLCNTKILGFNVKISMIAAMANNRIIGCDNKMPWHLPADLQHFKKVTMSKPVVMGRKTFESIGRPLPGRRNIIISRNVDYDEPGIEVVSSPEAAISLLFDESEIMIIGGGNVYKQFLAKADTLYLTFINLTTEGDTQFPDYEESATWQQVACEEYVADEKNKHDYKFVTLNKV